MNACPAAGKTGTVDDNTDAWFVGFTPRMSTSVWVGYPDNELVPMSYQFFGGPVDGGTFPAQIWGDYMNNVKGSYCGDFAPPKEPFVSSPFFGRYANSGGKHMEGGDEEADATTTTPDATDDTTDDTTGETAPPPSDTDTGTGFDPGAYESPPQGEPETETPIDPGQGGGVVAPPPG